MLAVVAVVAIAHGCVAEAWWSHAEALQAQADTNVPDRFDVSFVEEMALRPPTPRPTTRPAAVPRPKPLRTEPGAVAVEAKPPEPPASAPEPEPQPEALPPDAPTHSASASEPAASAPEPAASAAAAAAGEAASAPDATSADFDWPASTRLSYVLTGNYRGEVHGHAQVEWLKVGSRYQVRLEVTVGIPFAPLLQRRMVSEGEVTDLGLVPRRYDETTKRAFHDATTRTLRFEPHEVVLAQGERRPGVPGLQDSASQFVQLAWMFGLQPERLTPGKVVELPLALPRRIDAWVYDVGPEETLYTPFGHLQAVPLKPRRAPGEGGAMTAEIWFAPQMRFLPARIRIHQSADIWVDLMLARKPELAAR